MPDKTDPFDAEPHGFRDRGRTSLSRRGLFSAMLGRLGLPFRRIRQRLFTPGLGQGFNDPVIIAIARHKEALEAFNQACGLVDDVAATRTGRAITVDAFRQFEAAEKQASKAFADLLATPPETLKGMRHFLSYIREMDHDDTRAGLDTVLRSSLFILVDQPEIDA